MPIPKMSKIWMDGELVDWDDANVHVLSPSLHTGWAVFEGMRAYATDRGPAIFQHRAHVERLFRSAHMLGFKVPFTPDQILDGARDLCRINGQESYYIRPLVYLGYGEMGLLPIPSSVRVMIAAWPWSGYMADDVVKKGVSTKVSSWQRTGTNQVPSGAKASGAYLNAALAKVEAVQSGCDEAIQLNEHGRVASGSGENIFIVRDGVLITPPGHEGVLEGITRAAVIDFARDRDIPVEQSPMQRQDLYTADEAFLTGTLTELVSIRSVDDRRIGSPGPVTQQLQDIFFSVVRGREPKYDHMLDYVSQH